eukprot:TRINITY_DN547_c0_g1_i2.p1 TRINITY_DN547_c0_g1~~TRINITY_DN547_c0_g1_i2.p1  ORF type:complete len:448 (-),score=119.80 TRINITY_DN547_c0_g1_i2:37-1380(-)
MATTRDTKPTNSMTGDSGICPISALTPYNKWTIKVRVAFKSELNSYQRDGKKNDIFKMDLVDNSGDIRCTVYKDDAVRLYSQFEEGGVYYISRGSVKSIQKRYTSSNLKYEMVLNSSTTVEASPDDDLPYAAWNFTYLDRVHALPKDEVIDAVGIVEVGEVSTINTRAGKQLDKLEITLVDDSEAPIELTLWGQNAHKFKDSVSSQTIVGFKNLKVGEFMNKKQLSAGFDTRWEINPDVKKAKEIEAWVASKDSGELKTISQKVSYTSSGSTAFKNLQTVYDEELGRNGNYGSFWCNASITNIKHEGATLMYQACPSSTCQKKVEEQSGGFYCPKCDQTYPDFEYRYLLGMFIADHTASMFVSAFNDQGKIILGVPAEVVNESQKNDDIRFKRHFLEASFKTWNFRIFAKEDTYDGNTRVKYRIDEVKPLNLVQDSNRLIEEINKLM